MSQKPAIFERTARGFMPTEIARSPWNDFSINGAAIGGLLAALVEEPMAGGEKHVARLTVDILGTVPKAELEGRTSILRKGRRMELLAAEILANGRVQARATALCVRTSDTPAICEANPFPGPKAVEARPFLRSGSFGGTAETRPVRGAIMEAGPGTLWFKHGAEVVSGTPISPLMRAAIIADFGNGVGNTMPDRSWTFANLDIGINFLRMPRGEWLMIDAVVESAGNGHAIARNSFADEEGIYARGFQTLFIDKFA